MKVLPHVIRNINEFNIPPGDSNGYEIMYFGVNLILMFDYRLSFDIEVKNTYSEIGVLIISRSYVPAWKCNATNQDLNTQYGNHGTSEAYAFILDNRFSSIGDSETKKVEVILVHTWQQEIRESQLKDREVNDFKR